MEELRAYYRGSVKQRLTTLEALQGGVARRDPQATATLRALAHTLKGTGASYGFPEITAAAAAVLDAADEAVPARAAELVAVLREVAASGEEPP